MVNWKRVGLISAISAALALGADSLYGIHRIQEGKGPKPVKLDIPQVYMSLENLSATDGSSYHELLMADYAKPLEPAWGNHDVVLKVRPSPYLAAGDVLKIQPNPGRTASVVDVRYNKARGKWQVVYRVSHDILIEDEKSVTQQKAEAENANPNQAQFQLFPPDTIPVPDLRGRYILHSLDSLDDGSRTELQLEDGRTVVITGYTALNLDERIALGSSFDAVGDRIREGERVFGTFLLEGQARASPDPDGTVRVTDPQGTALRLFKDPE